MAIVPISLRYLIRRKGVVGLKFHRLQGRVKYSELSQALRDEIG